MFHVHLRNLECINMKDELKELFPQMENYVLTSIYEETLRGQVNSREQINENDRDTNEFKWKKLYHNEDKLGNKYKKYIFSIPNILDFVCPDQLTRENKEGCIENMSKFIAILCRRRKIYLDENHAHILLLVWDRVGRWRSIDEKRLIHEIISITTLEQSLVDNKLRELWRAGFLVKLENAYGIKQKLEL